MGLSQTENRPRTPRKSAGAAWWWAGAVLILIHLAILLLSPRFSPTYELIKRPILLLVGLELVAGVIWLVRVWPTRTPPENRRLLWYMLGVGLVLRGILLLSTPILEDDFQRYLWDGAMVAHGQNPYAHAPSELMTADPLSPLGRLVQGPLAQGRATLARINHPALRTVYPPFAQAAFAAAFFLSPWSLTAWRIVLIFFDITTLLLLLLLLRHLSLPPLSAAIYWWNPLFILHSVNGAHMDVLALPFLLAAILLTLRRKPVAGIALMSVAAGVKLWPLVLFPLLFRPLVAEPRRFISALAVASGILVLLAWPTIHGLSGTDSGFAAYAQRWEMNDALFMALLYTIRTVLGWFGSTAAASMITRIATLGILAVWIGWLAWQPTKTATDKIDSLLLAVAGLFLLCPTQFPWYYLWMLPLLALRPRSPLLLLSVLLSFYHLRFYFAARDTVGIFDYGIVWIEYVPVWILLLWAGFKRRPASRLFPPPAVERQPGS